MIRIILLSIIGKLILISAKLYVLIKTPQVAKFKTEQAGFCFLRWYAGIDINVNKTPFYSS